MKNDIYTPHLDIEATNICQASCIMCPREAIKKRGLGIMQPETFERVIFEAKKNNIASFGFSGLGEPLLNKNIFDYMRLVRKELGGIQIILLTNGELLDENAIQQIIDADVSIINISLQAVTPGLYATLMPGLDYAKVMKNIKNLIRMANPWTYLNISFTYHNMNVHELNKFLFYWRNYKNIHISQIKIHSRGGYIDTPDLLIDPIPDNIVTKECPIFSSINYIAWNGDILSCCHDAEGKNIIGNIHNDSFEEIRNKKFKIIEEGEWFPICARCTDNLRWQP